MLFFFFFPYFILNFKHSTSVQKFHFRGDDTNSDLCIQIQRTRTYRMVLWDIIGLLHYYKITILLRLIPPANTFKPYNQRVRFLARFFGNTNTALLPPSTAEQTLPSVVGFHITITVTSSDLRTTPSGFVRL